MNLEFSELTICKFCEENFKTVSVYLPCGHFVCKSHLDSILMEDPVICIICGNHELSVKDCLDMPFNKLKIKQNDLKMKIKNLNQNMETFDLVRREPEKFINENFKEINQTIEFWRDKLKVDLAQKIDSYYNELIDYLKNDQNKCLKLLKEQINLFDIKCSKIEMEPETEDKLNIDEIDCRIKEIDKNLNYYKLVDRILQKGTNYQLEIEPHDVCLENVFGKLVIENYSIEITNSDSFDLNNLNCSRTINESSVCFTLSKTNQIISGSVDGEIKIFNKKSGECLKIIKAHQDSIRRVEFLDFNLITGSFDNSIKIWNLHTEECLKTLNGHSDFISCLLITKNGEIFSGSADKTIKLWNQNSGECITTIKAHKNVVNELLELDEFYILSCSKDKTIKVWDRINNFECMKILNEHKRSVTSLLLLSTGIIVSGSCDFDIKIWDIFVGKCIKTLIGHSDWVVCLAKLDSNRIISGSADKTIKIWDSITGSCLKTLEGHSELVCCIQISSEAEIISSSKEIKIWKNNEAN